MQKQDDPALSVLIEGATDDLRELAQAEIELAKSELKSFGTTLAIALVACVASAVLLGAALGAFAAMIALMLGAAAGTAVAAASAALACTAAIAITLSVRLIANEKPSGRPRQPAPAARAA